MLFAYVLSSAIINIKERMLSQTKAMVVVMNKSRYPILLSALILFTAVSCQSGDNLSDAMTDGTAAVSASAVTEPASSLLQPPVLPERDYQNASFIFLNGNTGYTYGSVVSDEETGDSVRDAIYRRNLTVSERYNIRFEEVLTQNVTTDALKSVQAADNAFDIALMHVEDALSLTLKNAAVDYADIPYLNPDREWWLQQPFETMSLEGHNYFGVSMFDVSHFESTRVLYFNKRMINDLGLESPYTLIHNGTWTIDKMMEYGLAAIRDVNGDGMWTNDDCYAVSTWSNVGAPALMIGMNAPLTLTKDENDLPFFNMDTEYYIDRMTKLTDVLFCDEHFLISEYTGDLDFVNGHCLFYINLVTSAIILSALEIVRDMEDDFGIITQPKYNEEQDTYSNYGGSPFYMVIPQTAEDRERTGIMMEALAYESVGLLDTAYYDILLQGKIARDNESSEMLDLIFSTLCYQLPVAQQYVQTNLVDSCIWKNKPDFSSYFAKYAQKIQDAIDEAKQAYAENVGE